MIQFFKRFSPKGRRQGPGPAAIDFDHAHELWRWFGEITAAWEGFKADVTPDGWNAFRLRIEGVQREFQGHRGHSPRFQESHRLLDDGLAKLRRGCSYEVQAFAQAVPHLNAGLSLVQRAMEQCSEGMGQVSQEVRELSGAIRQYGATPSGQNPSA